MSKNPNWGGKRQGAGRPKKWKIVNMLVEQPVKVLAERFPKSPKQVSVGEKLRISFIKKVLNEWDEKVKPYRDRELKQQGAYRMVIQFLDEIKESDAKFDNVKREKPDFLW